MKRTKRTKIFLYVFLPIILLGISSVIFFAPLRTIDLSNSISKQKIPNPNAFDFYLSASKLIIDPNRSIEYAVKDQSHGYTLEEKAAILKTYEKAIQTFRKGLKYDCMIPNHVPDTMPLVMVPRNIARLNMLETIVLSEKGKYADAINNSIDGIKFSTDFTRGSSVIGALIGCFLESETRKEAWKQIRFLKANEAKTAAKKLEKILDKRYPLYKVFEDEKQFQITGIIKELASRNSGSKISLKEKIYIYNHLNYMDKLKAMSKAPYFSARKAPKPNSSFSEDVIYPARINFERNVMFSNMLLLELALRAYKLENGKYPNALSELVPTYLSKLPDDPYAPKGTFQYTNKGDKYLLYSIGPDFIDNKGLPIVYTVKNKIVEEDSKGDVVAGINYN